MPEGMPSAVAMSNQGTEVVAGPVTQDATGRAGKKGKNKLVPVVVILALLAVAGVTFGTVGMVQSFAKQDRIEALEAKIGELTEAGKDEGADKPSGDEGENNGDLAVEREKILTEVPSGLLLGGRKCLNADASEYNYGIHDAQYRGNGMIFSAAVNPEDGSGSVTVFWQALREVGRDWVAEDKEVFEEFSDLQLGGKATDVRVASFGNAGIGVALFLMEDGTVEYIPLEKAAKANNMKSYGKLKDVTEVMKIYQGSSIKKGAMVGGGDEAFAQRANGDYYALSGVLDEVGAFDI